MVYQFNRLARTTYDWVSRPGQQVLTKRTNCGCMEAGTLFSVSALRRAATCLEGCRVIFACRRDRKTSLPRWSGKWISALLIREVFILYIQLLTWLWEGESIVNLDGKYMTRRAYEAIRRAYVIGPHWTLAMYFGPPIGERSHTCR